MVQMVKTKKLRWPRIVIVPAGSYFRGLAKGAVHIAALPVGGGEAWIYALCGRRLLFDRRTALTYKGYFTPLPEVYKPCKQCIRRMRGHINKFEVGQL